MTGEDFDEDKVKKLARQAWEAAARSDWEAAGAGLEDIAARCGSDGIYLAIMIFCDTCITATFGTKGPPSDASMAPAWVDSDSGMVYTEAAEVMPSVRWAGQILTARAVLDRDGFDALIHAIPDDPLICGEYVMALLTTSVLTYQKVRSGGN